MRNEKEKLKEKRFSFFADPQERKAESRPTLHTFANHTSQPSNQNLQKSAILPTLIQTPLLVINGK